jgi:hypothetical protein
MSLIRGIGTAASGAATGATIGGPVGGIIGGGVGLLAGLFGGGDELSEEAAAKLQAAADAIKSIDIPEIDKAIALQQFQQSGTFTPELMEKIQLEADKKTALIENPENRARQEMALNALKELSQTGMSAIDRAQMAEMRSQVAQDLQAKNAQIMQEAQMRGQADGGQQLAQQLVSSQTGSQQASRDAMRQAAAAAQARQGALAQFGSMAGQVRSADVGTQQFNVQNELARQRFLDQNSLSRQQANIAMSNQARMANLQRQQQVSDINVQAANQELARQKVAQYQKFMGQLAKQSAIGNVYGAQAGLAQKQAAAEAGGIGSMLSGFGQLAGAGKDLGWWGGKDSGGTTDLKIGLGSGAKKAWKDMSDNWDPNAYEVLPAKNINYNPNVMYSAHGGRIPGEASVNGDSYKNDIIPAMLSPDEIVVPRTKAKDPKKAKSFIDEIFEQEKLDKKQKKGYDKNESILDLIAKLHSEKSK